MFKMNLNCYLYTTQQIEIESDFLEIVIQEILSKFLSFFIVIIRCRKNLSDGARPADQLLLNMIFNELQLKMALTQIHLLLPKEIFYLEAHPQHTFWHT